MAFVIGDNSAATEHTEEPRLAADTGNGDAATEHIEVPSYLQLFEISHDVWLGYLRFLHQRYQ